jgi:ketopantoate reductase
VLPAVRDLLGSTGQPIHISNDIQRERWHKLMWNAAFKLRCRRSPAVCPRRSWRNRTTRALVLALMNEVLNVGRACGVDLRAEDIDKHLAWTESATGLRTSTWSTVNAAGRWRAMDCLV